MRLELGTSRGNQPDLHILTPQQAFLAMPEGHMTDVKSWGSKAKQLHSDELPRQAPVVQAVVTPMDQQ